MTGLRVGEINDVQAEEAARQLAELIYDLVLETTLPKARQVIANFRTADVFIDDGDTIAVSYDLTISSLLVMAIISRVKRESLAQ
jgi:hypothetical protein